MRAEIATYGEEHVHHELVAALRARGVTDDIVRIDAMSLEERAAVRVIFGWRIPQAVIDTCPRLAWIQGAGAGVDWLLPITLPDAVVVTRIVDQFGPDMGEFALLAALAWVKDWGRILSQQAARTWKPYQVGQLNTLTVGVLGAGSIGGYIARMFQPLVREVRALATREPQIPGVAGYAASSWPAFYRGLDVLVMVLPHTPDTEHLVGTEQLGLMKRGGFVVNVGRGAVLDEAALVQAIRQGQLSGAALDVQETEPLPPESPLWDLPGVTVSPHVSGPSRRSGMADIFAENLRRFRHGEPLLGVVDRDRGY